MVLQIWCCDHSALHLFMAVVTFRATRLFVASIVDSVGHSALDRLGENLLDLLRHNGGVTTVLVVCLRGRLVSLTASGVNLATLLALYVFPAAYKIHIQSREGPPQDLKEPAPEPFWGQQSRQWRGTCPVRTRLWKTF